MQTGSIEAKITDNMISSLRSTKPWAKFLSILGFIGVAITVLLALAAMFLQNILPSRSAPAFLIGLLYLVFGVFYFFPSFYLFKYSSSIGRFLDSNGQIDMESALSYQKAFWKFSGIVALVMLIFAVLSIVAAIAIPMFLRMRMQGAGL